jgi:hypothetical protein
MNADDTFNTIIDDYTFPPVSLPIEEWPTEDLVSLSLKIDAELQKRADELESPIEDETIPPWEG